MACSRGGLVSSKSCRKPALNSVIQATLREYQERTGFQSNFSIIRSRFDVAKNLYRKDLFSHFGCVNAIEFSNDGQWLASGGDDRRVLLWNVEKAVSGVGQPQGMRGEHTSNIFCMAFDSGNRRMFSAGNDEQVMIHDTETGETLDIILHGEAIYGISVDPLNDNLFATACNDGGIFIYDMRESNENPHEALAQLRSQSPFHAVMHNPTEPRLLATANTKEGVGLWDVRKTRGPLVQFTDCLRTPQSAMSVRFNCRGTQILALRRRHPPILYNLTSPYPVAEFDHSSYYNSCTMKSCCFAGDDDQFVLSGSDDFKLYAWKIPKMISDRELTPSSESLYVNEADIVLSGHRSIVNQVRYNYRNGMIASSGVEKVIKLWSVFPLPSGFGSLEAPQTAPRDNRKVYSHEDYINLVLESGQFMTHDYSHQSVQEDPRMMAFFDSLVQRDIEGWTSDSSDDSLEGHQWYRYCFNPNENSSSSSSDSSGDEMQLQAPQIQSYLSSLSSRIKTRRKPAVGTDSTDPSQPSTSSAPSRFSSTSGTSGILKPEDLVSEANKITQLITEKKREQLRRVARLAVRTTRKKLKRIKKSGLEASTAAENSTANCDQKFSELTSISERLSQEVETDAKNCAEENKTRRSRYKLRRRLRYLTDQSDYILNEVFPGTNDSSDSDSSDMSDPEIVDRVVSHRFPMRDLLRDSSSDSSSDTLVAESSSGSSNDESDTRATDPPSPLETNQPPVPIPPQPSESANRLQELEPVDLTSSNGAAVDNNVNNSESSARIGGDKSSKVTESKSSEALNNCSLQSGPIVKLGPEEMKNALECLCPPNNRGSSGCPECSKVESGTTGATFKPISVLNRCYRKRKLNQDEESTSCNEGVNPGDKRTDQNDHTP